MTHFFPLSVWCLCLLGLSFVFLRLTVVVYLGPLSVSGDLCCLAPSKQASKCAPAGADVESYEDKVL